jgi:hypothetical protein
VLVGANTTANAGMIFQPQEIRAVQGDVVVFNCEYSLLSVSLLVAHVCNACLLRAALSIPWPVHDRLWWVCAP